MTPERFSLEVPHSADHLATVRIFAASLARRFGCDSETIADLKLALSEAATLALQAGEEPVRVEVTATPSGLDFSVAVSPEALALDDDLGGVELIRALFAGSGPAPDENTIVIRVATGRS